MTRPREQASALEAALRAAGAEPVVFPTVRIADPPDPGALRRAARRVGAYDWVIFTSANGVARFWSALEAEGRGAADLARARVAAIGPATARALAARGVTPAVVPERYLAEGMVEALRDADRWPGRRVLLPRAREARDLLPRRLAEWGAEVDVVAAYEVRPERAGADRVRAELRAGRIDAVTFTASSTVRHFVDAVGADVGRAVVAAIGPVTARTARACGLPVHVVAEVHTIDGLVAALGAHFGAGGGA